MLDAAAESAMTPTINDRSACRAAGRNFSFCRRNSRSRSDLDSSKIQEWAAAASKEEHPEWLGDFDEDVDQEMPLRSMIQLIGVGVLMRRKPTDEPVAQPKRRRFLRRS